MIQLHNQNREELVKALLKERNESKDILGRMPEVKRREKLEDMIDKKIQEYINEKDG
jgi:Mg/Co/Ni transporter MgtE